MSQTVEVSNPFMLLLNPEVVLAAIERSERLGQLNRHLCRPLDKPAAGSPRPDEEAVDAAVELADEAEVDAREARQIVASAPASARDLDA